MGLLTRGRGVVRVCGSGLWEVCVKRDVGGQRGLVDVDVDEVYFGGRAHWVFVRDEYM